MPFRLVEDVIDAVNAIKPEEVVGVGAERALLDIEIDGKYHFRASDHKGDVAVFPGRTGRQVLDLIPLFANRHIYLDEVRAA